MPDAKKVVVKKEVQKKAVKKKAVVAPKKQSSSKKVPPPPPVVAVLAAGNALEALTIMALENTTMALTAAEARDRPPAAPVARPGFPVICRCENICVLRQAECGRVYWNCARCRFKAWASRKGSSPVHMAPREVHCTCGSQCTVIVSHSVRNPGRLYWRCPPGSITAKGKLCAISGKFVCWAGPRVVQEAESAMAAPG
jgi:hypothetical protein